MSLTSFVLILTGVLLNAAAQLLLKAGAGRVPPLELELTSVLSAGRELFASAPIIAGLTCYVVSVAVWIAALTRVEVSVAYPMLSIGYVVNALAAWALFGEELTFTRIVGIGIIIAGVYVIAGTGRGR